MVLWPHQPKAVADVLQAIRLGERRILLTSPTGGGKTRIAEELIALWLQAGEKVVLYSNRKLMVDQLSRSLERAGLYHGIRAAGYGQSPESELQVSSIQTEVSRVLKGGSWGLFPASRVIIDECHLQRGARVQELIQAHLEQDAVVLGLTATPLDLAGYYDSLLVAGTTSALRTYGALVPARHYAPDEPDRRRLKVQGGVDLTEPQQRKAMSRPGLFGRVWENFERINPDHRPTLLFAPCVSGSIWFAEQFAKKGVSAAHIDGEHVWHQGKLWQNDRRLRQEVLDASRDGSIRVLCNRFVLREGVDCPWLAHGILATVFGSLQSYLQAGGRLLRTYPGLESVTIQDHGGNCYRHGSLNEDRYWCLNDTNVKAYQERADRLREGKQPSPFRCPQCNMVLARKRCPCGWVRKEAEKVSRPVVTEDGTLRLFYGDVFAPRPPFVGAAGPKLWERIYWRSRTEKGSRTFAAAMSMFALENGGRWPDPSWPFMPVNATDKYRLVGEVPIADLIPKESSRAM